MKFFWRLLHVTMVMAALAGCKPSSSSTTSAPTAADVPVLPTEAQPKLQTIKLWIGPQEMTAELALTEPQERAGMMFRTNMAENEGMLFVFPQPVQASFWMKNTVLPLSAAYISPDGTIQEIHDLQPQDTNSVVAETDNIQFVLETRQGWFKRNNIAVGAVVSTERGSLRKVFLER